MSVPSLWNATKAADGTYGRAGRCRACAAMSCSAATILPRFDAGRANVGLPAARRRVVHRQLDLRAPGLAVHFAVAASASDSARIWMKFSTMRQECSIELSKQTFLHSAIEGLWTHANTLISTFAA
jgi:hypothetical protein